MSHLKILWWVIYEHSAMTCPRIVTWSEYYVRWMEFVISLSISCQNGETWFHQLLLKQHIRTTFLKQTYNDETSVTSEACKHHYKHNFYCQKYLSFYIIDLAFQCDSTMLNHRKWQLYRTPWILHVAVRLTGISIHNDKLHYPYLCRELSENSAVSCLLT